MYFPFLKNHSTTMPKVTVAIPTYNRREHLREAVKSVLAQTFQDFVIIVFDNHSDYDVRAFLDEFNDSRISAIVAPVNEGNYNRIFTHGFDSEYAILFHDDDVMHPELLAREVAVLDAHPELIWVGTDLQFVRSGVRMHDFVPVKSDIIFTHDAAGIVRLILQDFDLCFGSVMYRVYCLTGSPLIELYSKWGDRPYLIDLLHSGKAGIIKEKLVNYRIHPGQDSQAVAPDSAQYAINLLLFYKKCLHDLQIASDRRLFYRHAVDNLVPAAIVSSRTIAEFKQFLLPYRQHGLVRLRYITPKGVFRSLRALVRTMQKKLPWKN